MALREMTNLSRKRLVRFRALYTGKQTPQWKVVQAAIDPSQHYGDSLLLATLRQHALMARILASWFQAFHITSPNAGDIGFAGWRSIE